MLLVDFSVEVIRTEQCTLLGHKLLLAETHRAVVTRTYPIETVRGPQRLRKING